MAAPLVASAAVTVISGVGPKRAEQLRAAGVCSVGDLLRRLPSTYQDRRTRLTVAEARQRRGDTVVVCGQLRALRRIRARRGLVLVRGRLVDDSGELAVVWFNRPYLSGQIDERQRYLLVGRMREGRTGPELLNAEVEREETAGEAGIVPVYGPCGELGPTLIRRLVAEVLDRLAPDSPEDPLPTDLLRRRSLPTLDRALRFLHRPPGEADLEPLCSSRTPSHRRLLYGELLELQLILGRQRESIRSSRKPHSYRTGELREVARDLLPFPLTAAQRRVVREIVRDLESPFPMLRLLQGDVGCGKTVVAGLAMLAAAESGLQAAYMAPTEILAEQQARSLSELVGARHRLALLSASRADDGVRSSIASGEVKLVVGTHALIQDALRFDQLSLAIVDEQHRFGVDQRRALEAKGERSDLLVMSATPIPRSLALVLYGDLDISVIDELPPGRRPVVTEAVPERRRSWVLEELRREVRTGGQAYVVFPLIEDSGRRSGHALEKLGRDYERGLADLECRLLTGRTGAAEREEILSDFAAGKVSVLLATTVIEVGVDVPAATLMVIESAEVFGLSQLHQLRGRVGRGERPSRCLAVYGERTPEARSRLQTFVECDDGFALAEADLRLRGPGDLLGVRQAGLARLLGTGLDPQWLAAAREDARTCLERLNRPELAALRRALEQLEQGDASAAVLAGA